MLLVDDSADNVELYELALGLEGAEVAAVLTADDALSALDAAPFDVVVSDIHLERVDGYALMREVRRRAPDRGGSVAAIALTGLVSPFDRAEALEAGFDEHLTKPCAPSDLEEAIRAVLARRAARAEPRAAAEPVSLAGLRILVVDDGEVDRYLLVRALTARGAEVEAVASADEAVAALDSVSPHVLVSDLVMPGTSGFELLGRVRTRSADRGGRIPAVAVTVLASPEDRREVLESGFAEHVTKPFDPDRLAAIVAALATSSS